MGKITILEAADFLRVKLLKLLKFYRFDNTEVISALINNNVGYTFKDSSLIILDLDNHKLDVVGIIEQIKEDSRVSRIPIMLLSSQADIKTLKKALQAGCSDFVTKPFSDDILIQKIHKLMKREYQDIGLPTSIKEDPDPQETSFTWQSDYEIGIEEIDREHKAIIDSYEKLYQYMKSGRGHEYYNEMIDFLEKYVNDHFAHEEAFQASIGYDKRSEHARYHLAFKEQIGNMINTHKEREVTNLDLIKFNLFIKDWLLHHILLEDAKIGEFLKNKK